MHLIDRAYRIYQTVCENPGILQCELGELIGSDKTFIRNMWRAGILKRVPAPDTGRKTYRLFPVEAPDVGESCKPPEERKQTTPVAAIEGNMRKSALHRADIRSRVREAMLQNPQISLRKLCRKVGGTQGTVGVAYHQFKRGEL